MIPKIYVKEHGYPAFGHFGIAPIPAGMVRTDLLTDGPPMVPNVMEIPPNANIESILQVHRRKMLRRAANRRSAQLSRARKKVTHILSSTYHTLLLLILCCCLLL